VRRVPCPTDNVSDSPRTSAAICLRYVAAGPLAQKGTTAAAEVLSGRNTGAVF